MAFYETLPDRMRQIVDELGKDKVSQRKLSASAGESHAWVGTILSGASSNPGAITLAQLCEEYGYNVRWLITGLGPKFIDRADDDRYARERGEPLSTSADEAAKRILERRPRKT